MKGVRLGYKPAEWKPPAEHENMKKHPPPSYFSKINKGRGGGGVLEAGGSARPAKHRIIPFILQKLLFLFKDLVYNKNISESEDFYI